MTREGKRPLAAFIAAVLVAALLAACGGSDSDSSSSTEATTTTSGSTTPGATTGDGNQGERQSQDADQSRGDDQAQADSGDDGSQDQRSGEGAPDDADESDSQGAKTPLKVSGGGAEQFQVKGGDNSIQEFGEESDESELQAAAEAVHSFYVARVEEQWDTACSYLSKSNIEDLEKLAAQSPKSQGADCATVLDAFTRPLPAELEHEITTVDAGSLRREGDQGFLIYYGAGHETYAMPLIEEGGSWKLTALSGVTLS